MPCCAAEPPTRTVCGWRRAAGGAVGCSGMYVTRRPGAGSRPYSTMIQEVDPVEGRCDCPDFVKNSLGICRAHPRRDRPPDTQRPRLLQQAKKEQEWSDPKQEMA